MKMLALAMAAAGLSLAASAQVVGEVRVESADGAPVDPGSVLSAVEVRSGQAFDLTRVMRDTKALEATGRFSSVRVHAVPQKENGKVDVVFEVAARPLIESLSIAGADEIGNRTVREWLGIGIGDRIDDALMAAAARRVQEEYAKRHRPNTRIAWTLSAGRDPGAVRVSVTVREGERVRVSDIRFAGNTALTDAELRARMKQKRYRWFNPVHWFTDAGRSSEEDARADLFELQKAFRDLGYLDVVIRGPAVVPQPGGRVLLKYIVSEGPKYQVGSVAIEGVTRFPTGDVARLVRLPRGAIASQSAMDDAREAIADYYGNRGYADVRVRAHVDADPARGVANVRFEVREGDVSRIRDIVIRGNSITKDSVIRRELVVAPGEPFHRARVRTSENRIRNLGYFSHVATTTEPTDEPGRQDLVIDVTEDRMGTAEAGVAFSSIDRIVGRAEIGHGNIDLGAWPPFGGGQKIRLGALFGTQRQDYYLTFIEPYLFDQKLRLTVDLFQRESRFFSSLYDVSRLGGQVSLERPIGRYYAAGIAYGLERIEISGVDESASEAIKAEEGRRLKSSVEISLTRDTRDRTRLPTRGNFARASAEVAGGPLGGDTQWFKLELRSNQYVPVWRDHVLLLRGQAGVVDGYGDEDRVPLFDRYFLGGLYTLRAFKYRHVGPVDDTGEPLGGSTMAFASAEYTVPVYKMVRLAAFLDGGMVWEDPWKFDLQWNSGYGVGIRLDIPMLPLRIDYAWQLESDDFNRDDNGRFNISFGYPF